MKRFLLAGLLLAAVAVAALLSAPARAQQNEIPANIVSLSASGPLEVAQAWQRRDEVEPGNLEVARSDEPVTWAIWRPERISSFRSLEPDEAAMLDALVAGRTFPELCETVAAFTGDDQAPARAAWLLRTWVEGGMIASFKH